LPSTDHHPQSSAHGATRGRGAVLLAIGVATGAAPTLLVGIGSVDGGPPTAVQAQAPVAPEAATSTPAPRYGTWGIDLRGMDTSVEPGDDFFRYVNGRWVDRTKIPADHTTYGVAALLRELSERQVRAIIDDWNAASDLPPASDEAKVGAFYGSFMDEATVERRGATPLRPHLDRIKAATTHDALGTLMGGTTGVVGGSFFRAAVRDDLRDPEHYALYLFQGDLGLPDREFYLRDTFTAQKEAYGAYVEEMLGLIDWDRPAENAAAIVALETTLAEAHWSRAESRDRDATYNPTTFDALERDAPGFPWKTWAAAAKVAGAPKAIVSQDTAFPKLAAAFRAAPVETLQAWQAFHTADQAAPYLSKPFVDAHWTFRAKTLQGAREQRERWKRGVAFAEQAMGEAIGREYVKRHFPPASKAKMDALVRDLETAMSGRIERLDWMAPDTKTAALDKLAKLAVRIGYPDDWRDYSTLAPRRDDLFGNLERSGQFEWTRDAGRIGKPVEEGEWEMTPQTVNAYYSAAKNEIVFPAAILQPPFFGPDADPAVNYGAIGGVIGHEITHGFDDQGRKSDGDGVLRDWWGTEDARKFEARSAKLGAQYETITFPQLPGMKLTGRLGMGENIADLGGILLGLDAYRLSLKGAEAPVLDGFTGTQRVLMGWAQAWRVLYRDEALRQQIVNGPHCPGFVRAYAPLRNVDEWYEAFGVEPGDALYVPPAERVRIW